MPTRENEGMGYPESFSNKSPETQLSISGCQVLSLISNRFIPEPSEKSIGRYFWTNISLRKELMRDIFSVFSYTMKKKVVKNNFPLYFSILVFYLFYLINRKSFKRPWAGYLTKVFSTHFLLQFLTLLRSTVSCLYQRGIGSGFFHIKLYF